MSEQNNCNSYVQIFAEEYMEKIFYFCLRKTGDQHEAEELLSDIALCVVTGLQKVCPESFSAWVWRIVKNRYAHWVDVKHKRNNAESGADISELEIAAEHTVESEVIKKEDMSLLRRELAFISSEYRDIIVAYYIQDKPVRLIAQTLAVSEGLVKTRLFRARKILKEGMDMAREFGKLSYAPENIGFINCGIFGAKGEPETLISAKLAKNILLAAYKTPSTAEELSVELGVALPYMEDELERLVNATLIRKNGKKYETNFCIISAEAQSRIYGELKKTAPRFTASVIDLLEFDMKCRDANNDRWHEGYQSMEDAKWALLADETDEVVSLIFDEYRKHAPEPKDSDHRKYTPRPNGGCWDLVGLETYTGDDNPSFVGKHGVLSKGGESKIDFIQYKFGYNDMWARTPAFLTHTQAAALESVCRGECDGISEEVLEELASCGYLTNDGNGYRPALLVIKKENTAPLSPAQENQRNALVAEAVKAGYEQYVFCRGAIAGDVPDFFKNDRYQINFACSVILRLLDAVCDEAIKQGYLKDSQNKSIGAVLKI